MRNLPEKVAEFAQLHYGATAVQRLWEAASAYHIRMRMTIDFEKVHVAAGQRGSSDNTQVKIAGKIGHQAKDCWQRDPSKKPAAAAAKPAAKPKTKAGGNRLRFLLRCINMAKKECAESIGAEEYEIQVRKHGAATHLNTSARNIARARVLVMMGLESGSVGAVAISISEADEF